MKILIKGALIFLYSCASLSAQKNIDPTVDDIQLAKKIREQYLKDDVAILESKEDVSFGINKGESKVTVSNTVNELLMNINYRADIHKYEFYDSQSKIETFSLKYRNQKNAAFQVKDEFYKDNDLFYNDARVKYMQVDFPVQGYTYNYTLEKKYEDVKYFTSLYFNDEFPVLKKEINISVPDWLNVELKEFNFEGNDITKSKKQDTDSHTIIYTYTVNNVPAYYKDENAPGRSYLYPHLLLIAKSFKDKDKTTTLFNSTADLYKWYKSLVNQIGDDPSVFKAKVAELTASAKTDEEKIKNIYYWVQDNIRYIAFEDGIAGFKPDASNNVFQKRFGDCKGMANLIKQMLVAAGYDARLSWIGTKHIAYDYTTPSLAVDNHMICTLYLKGKKYFLDGTEKYNSFGTYAERIQNKEVMIENGDSFTIEKIPVTSSETNKELFRANFTIENEKLIGNCSRNYSGESCVEFLQIFNSFETDKQGETLEKYLSGNDKNVHIDNIKNSDFKNRDQKLDLSYSIAIENRVSGFDSDMYIDLDYRNEYRNFEMKDRKTDYEFDHKTNYESIITLAIPSGYKVSKLPADLNIAEDDFNVALSYVQSGKEIIYKKSFVFKNALIKKSELAQWNAFVKNLNVVYNQQIVLSKQ